MFSKQSTARAIIVGPILDSAGAEYASAVIGDLSISKNGGTLTAMASAATLVYIANGYYTLTTTTGNTDTLGWAEISCNKSTYQMPPVRFMVCPATVFDALITNATTAVGGLGDVQRVAGTAQTARDIGASVLLSSGTGTGQLDFTSGVVKSDTRQWLGTTVSTPTVAGVPNVNAKTWNDLTCVALPLTPTAAGRTLDVTATGAAGIDWANVENATTAVSLAETVTKTVGTVTTLTNLPAITANWLTASGIALDAAQELGSAASQAIADDINGLDGNWEAAELVLAARNWTSATRTLTDLPAITAGWLTATGIASDAFTAAKFAASSLNGKGDWNIGKTGYSLTATTGLGNQTANITGNLVGNVTGTVILGNTAHGGVSATLVLSDYSNFTGAAASSPTLLQTTTIATLASQTSFTLTSGSADNDAYNNAVAVFIDASTSTQKAFVRITDYVGSTKTVTLEAAPAFTITTTDTVNIIAGTGLDVRVASLAAAATIGQVVADDGTMTLYEGMTYNGTLMAKPSWTVTKDYTGVAYTAITLTIWRVNDDDTATVMKTATATADSSTAITASFTATFLLSIVYAGCPPFEKLRYDLVATQAGGDEEIDAGDCYVFRSEGV